MRALGIGRGAFLDAAERLQRQGRLIKPRQGFYVIVPPQFLSWGAPPPSWYIDDLMRFAGRSYYVGLLKASELHGATHQAVMEFHVVTDKQLSRIQAGRSVIACFYRRRLPDSGGAVEAHKTDTGVMMVSSAELTALDLVRYAPALGGLDNVATVLTDLAAKIDAEKLALLSIAFERSVVQRLGYLLDVLGFSDSVGLLNAESGERSSGWVELDPAEARDPVFAPNPVDRDPKWRVVARSVPEVDR